MSASWTSTEHALLRRRSLCADGFAVSRRGAYTSACLGRRQHGHCCELLPLLASRRETSRALSRSMIVSALKWRITCLVQCASRWYSPLWAVTLLPPFVVSREVVLGRRWRVCSPARDRTVFSRACHYLIRRVPVEQQSDLSDDARVAAPSAPAARQQRVAQLLQRPPRRPLLALRIFVVTQPATREQHRV